MRYAEDIPREPTPPAGCRRYPQPERFTGRLLDDEQRCRPEYIDTADMFRDAVEEKVAYIPGSVFSGSDGYHNTMRLNFANLETDAITEGIRRLSKVVRSHL